jgi:HK97 family phage portal protein
VRDFLKRLFLWPPNTGNLMDAGVLPGVSALELPWVNAENALRLTPVYRAVSLIATDAARLSVDMDDARVMSLMETPSPYMSAFDLRRALTVQMLLFGNAFAAINRTALGEPIELIPLKPGSVTLDLISGSVIYKTNAYGDLTPDQVLHLRASGTSPLWGDSPVDLCAKSLRLLGAHEEMSFQNYRRGGNPKLSIVHPGKLSQEAMQRMEDQYARKHAGAENAGRPIVLAEGMKVERISSTMDDTGLEAARRYSVGDVSRIYGVPASYLSESVGSSYGTMEWLSRMYVSACLAHWMSPWVSEIKSKLGAVADFDYDDLMRPSLVETMNALRTGVESGIITRNEAREELDMLPLPGLDAPIVAKNMGTGGGMTNAGTDTSMNAGVPS